MCHAYNAMIHSSTGFLPYYIMFGRHPKLAIDSLLRVNVDNLHAKTQHENTRKLHDRLYHAHKKAREKAIGTSEQHKAHYDVKAHASKLDTGDIVLVRNEGNRRSETGGRRILISLCPSPTTISLYMALKRIHQQQVRCVVSTETCYSRYDSSGTVHQSTSCHNVVVASTLITINLI